MHESVLIRSKVSTRLPDTSKSEEMSPLAARKSTRVPREYKTKYRVTNWRQYERGLRSRDDLTVWFSDEAGKAWTPPNNGRSGGRSHY